MSLLPIEGVYKFKTEIEKFLYVRGFNPYFLRQEKPSLKTIELVKKLHDGRREVKIDFICTSAEQEELLDKLLQKRNLSNTVILFISKPQVNGLVYITHWIYQRLKLHGWQEIYCIDCFKHRNENPINPLDTPELLVLYNFEENPEARAFAISLTYDYPSVCSIFVFQPTKQDPISEFVSLCKVKPNAVFRV